MSYNNEIEELLYEEQEVYDDSFRVDSLEKAVWADEKVRENELEIQKISKIAESKINELEEKIKLLQDWKEKSSSKFENNISFFKQHLHIYHQNEIETQKAKNTELEANGKKPKALPKTIKLPYRNLTCKVQAPGVLIYGKEPEKAKLDPQFVEFVKSNDPNMIKSTEEVKWGEFKKTLNITEVDGNLVYVDGNGEIVDSIQITRRGESYDWKSTVEEENEEN